MQCRYCNALNNADDRRCSRCGRRLHLSAPRPAPDAYPSPNASATALAFEAIPGRQPVPPEAAGLNRQPLRAQSITYQPSLFRDVPGAPKVIPIPALTPRGRERREPRLDISEIAMPGRNSRGRRRSRNDSQQSLDFHGDPDAAQIDPVIGCDAPVAPPLHRSIAAVVDISMVLVAVGLFLAIFFMSGGDIPLTPRNAPFLGLVVAALALFYRFLFCIAGGDTPGMRFAGLKLVDFDGRKPDSEQRWVRLVASLLSVVSVGLALFWVYIDEEKLTWHDQISKTFPTTL